MLETCWLKNVSIICDNYKRKLWACFTLKFTWMIRRGLAEGDKNVVSQNGKNRDLLPPATVVEGR